MGQYPVTSVTAGIFAELEWPHDGNVAHQRSIPFYACWWRQWLELCFSVFKGMPPETLKILYLPLKRALFCLFGGGLAWWKSSKYSVFSINSVASLQDGSQIPKYPVWWINWNSVPTIQVHFRVHCTSLWLLCQHCPCKPAGAQSDKGCSLCLCWLQPSHHSESSASSDEQRGMGSRNPKKSMNINGRGFSSGHQSHNQSFWGCKEEGYMQKAQAKQNGRKLTTHHVLRPLWFMRKQKVGFFFLFCMIFSKVEKKMQMCYTIF